MRLASCIFTAIAVIISGCQNNSDVRGYWSSRSLDLENISAAEEQFADFAQLAAKAGESDAFAGVDMLLKKAAKDEVTYLVYSDWIIRSFCSISSPCHNCRVFVHAADKILSQGTLSSYEADNYRRCREFCLHNQPGDKAEIPLIPGDDSQFTGRTLFLVVDQDCPACRESMQRFCSDAWKDTRLVALCYGHGQLPAAPGWDCRKIPRDQTIIDTRQAPLFFVMAPDGTIEISYTSVSDETLL